MSGQPYPAGVAALRKLATRHHKLEREILTLKSEIGLKSHRLQLAKEERQKVHTKLIAALEKMDCASSGNFGWEARIAWMLGEFASQRNDVEAEPSLLDQESPTTKP